MSEPPSIVKCTYSESDIQTLCEKRLLVQVGCGLDIEDLDYMATEPGQLHF